MEPIVASVQKAFRSLRSSSRKWARKLRTRARRLQKSARVRLRSVMPRQPRVAKKSKARKTRPAATKVATPKAA